MNDDNNGTRAPGSCSTEQRRSNGSANLDDFTDGFFDAGAAVIAQLRDEWARETRERAREMEVMQAQARETIAVLRAELVESRHQLGEAVRARMAELRDGRDGEPGRNGERGAQGERGEPGAAGAAGPIGPQGERGDPGEPGRNGADGLRGEPGAPGERGAQGEQGAAGEPGRNGEPGPQGERGEKGERGERGEPGLPGSPGAPGEPGRNGERGERGPIGPAGPAGPQGERGLPGVQGERGADGQAGAKGERGEPGPRGMIDKIAAWSDQIFYQGQLATHQGASWQATRDTAKEPGRSDDWQLIAAAGAPGGSFNIRGTYTAGEKYRHLDVVTLDYGWFVAKHDDPGPIPGPGWQAGPVGRRGEKGVPGERGAKGEAGKPAPHWIGVKLDGYNLVAVMSDGAVGPRVSLAPMFEQFGAELTLRSK